MEQVHAVIRRRGLSYRTEQTYCDWIRRIRTVQKLLSHTDVKTTRVYTHVLHRGGLAQPVGWLNDKTPK
jgi:integrase